MHLYLHHGVGGLAVFFIVSVCFAEEMEAERTSKSWRHNSTGILKTRPKNFEEYFDNSPAYSFLSLFHINDSISHLSPHVLCPDDLEPAGRG